MNPLVDIRHLGQSLWLDFISRQLLVTGELKRCIDEDGLAGVTSNPTIFEKAIGSSDDYNETIYEQVRQGKSMEDIYQNLTVADVQMACDLFRPRYETSRDGYVSLEVSPGLAYDTVGTIAEARWLWHAVDRPNVMIKIPATLEGLPAIEQLIFEGINVNVTLIFGLNRYRAVVDAYISGLENRIQTGKPLHRIDSVASFFVSRIDVLIDSLLEPIVADHGLHHQLAQSLVGKVAVASARQAYQLYKEAFSSTRWAALRTKGATTQRLLWASTGNKNPRYDELKYVEELIGPDTINTIPVETLAIFKQRGNPANRLEHGLAEAQIVLRQLSEIGLDLEALTHQLETAGIQKFINSFANLVALLEKKSKTALPENVI